MGMFDTCNLERAALNMGCGFRGRAATDLRYCETEMIDDLRVIVRRAELLLEQLSSPETAWHAVNDIASAAGASGPIGSRWEKLVAHATTCKTLGEYGTERTV